VDVIVNLIDFLILLVAYYTIISSCFRNGMFVLPNEFLLRIFLKASAFLTLSLAEAWRWTLTPT
jgi:hypothetical protein